MSYTIDKIEYLKDQYEYQITITFYPNSFLKFFGSQPKTKVFIGDCTVWYKKNNSEYFRCSTSTEYFLYQIWKDNKYSSNMETKNIHQIRKNKIKNFL